MAKKPVYRSYRGKLVDMDGLRAQHENEIALGNMGVNAKGDKLGPGGKVVASSQQRVRKHYKGSSQVKKISIKNDVKEEEDVKVFPDEEKKKEVAKKPARKTKKVERETESGDIIIEEVETDEDE